VLLLFCRVGNDAEKLEGFAEGILKLVEVTRSDKQALTFGYFMPGTVLVNGYSTSTFDLYNMLIVMIMEGCVSSGSNIKVAHYDVSGSVFRTNEYLHSYLGCTFHLYLRCQNLFVVVYLHCLSSDFYSKLPVKHFREAKVLSGENEFVSYAVSASSKN
jgi:hypothetical protein